MQEENARIELAGLVRLNAAQNKLTAQNASIGVA